MSSGGSLHSYHRNRRPSGDYLEACGFGGGTTLAVDVAGHVGEHGRCHSTPAIGGRIVSNGLINDLLSFLPSTSCVGADNPRFIETVPKRGYNGGTFGAGVGRRWRFAFPRG